MSAPIQERRPAHAHRGWRRPIQEACFAGAGRLAIGCLGASLSRPAHQAGAPPPPFCLILHGPARPGPAQARLPRGAADHLSERAAPAGGTRFRKADEFGTKRAPKFVSSCAKGIKINTRAHVATTRHSLEANWFLDDAPPPLAGGSRRAPSDWRCCWRACCFVVVGALAADSPTAPCNESNFSHRIEGRGSPCARQSTLSAWFRLTTISLGGSLTHCNLTVSSSLRPSRLAARRVERRRIGAKASLHRHRVWAASKRELFG